MKNYLAAAGLIALLFVTGPLLAGEKTVTLDVEGMTCASCPYMVKKSLTKIDGIKNVDVSLETKLAVVTYDDAKTNIDTMTKATLEAGFPSKLKVEGQASETSGKMSGARITPRGSAQ